MDKVRAKFKVNAILPGYGKQSVIHMNAVYSSEPGCENKIFTDATPSAYMSICIEKEETAAFFEMGKEYYLDFTPVDKTSIGS